jgi:hypothetical protein
MFAPLRRVATRTPIPCPWGYGPHLPGHPVTEVSAGVQLSLPPLKPLEPLEPFKPTMTIHVNQKKKKRTSNSQTTATGAGVCLLGKDRLNSILRAVVVVGPPGGHRSSQCEAFGVMRGGFLCGVAVRGDSNRKTRRELIARKTECNDSITLDTCTTNSVEKRKMRDHD